MKSEVELYDTTLRDGCQREGLTLSLEDKLKIAQRLDQLGIHYIEGGYPGSNPRDQEFFARARAMTWQHATVTAFGSTRYKTNRAEDDPNLQALLDTEAAVCTLVCKNSERHVRDVLGTTLDENLAMIADSIRFLRTHGRRVFYDAEHFFDGWRENAAYARACLRTAAEAGAECLVLCDTNGGMLTEDVTAMMDQVIAAVQPGYAGTFGIHAHNDAELAVANSLAAVRAGATHIQGTINGYGERCGNANLCSIIPNLVLKMGVPVVKEEQLAWLTESARYVAELANIALDPHLPYVGHSAFAHKAGYHADGMMKSSTSYQHSDPTLVGNDMRILISELSGRKAIATKLDQLGVELTDGVETSDIVERVKQLEHQGYQFEGAEASFDLLVRRRQADYRRPFELEDFLIVVETHRRREEVIAEATVKIRVGDEVQHTAGHGNGPVNALDDAMRKALLSFYPQLAAIRLTDYKVRVVDAGSGTAATVRVLIESTNGPQTWSTVGSHTNIIQASWQALADSLEYGLLLTTGASPRYADAGAGMGQGAGQQKQ
ncbi:MAG: citramalate synthase [Rhodospirillaceae bacterium]|nr:citramalate synthase [Rhodospirillaceae bacterium]